MQDYGRFAYIYDRLMRGVGYDDWAKYISRLLGDAKTVIECGCGTGELTMRLAKMGFFMTGLDISEDMLGVASEKLRKNGLTVPLICMDMAEFCVHTPADAILCACYGVNYLTSVERTAAFFSSSFRALKPGGTLLFDVSTKYKLERIIANNTFASDEGDAAYIWDNSYDRARSLCEMRLTFFSRRDQLYERFEETHVQRAHTERELRGALAETGFGSVRVYDAFTLEPPKPESERLQFIAKKDNT